MIVKTPPDAVKDANTRIPQEPGKGALLLANTTYYFECSFADADTASAHVSWDAALIATSINFQDCNFPPYRGTNEGAWSDKDAGVDVSIFDATPGNWVTQDPSTAYIPAGTGYTVTNNTIAVAGTTANGTMFDLGNVGSRRGRIRVVVGATGGFFRMQGHGKIA